MARDYFAALGLAPARYTPDAITTAFLGLRARLLRELDDTGRHDEVRGLLDDAYIAYNALRDPVRQADCRVSAAEANPVATIRTLIAASLEGGLLRHSRRCLIIARARELGLSEFHAQLLIAQVQCGTIGFERTPAGFDEALLAAGSSVVETPRRLWPQLGGVALLAGALFTVLVRWVHV